MLLICSDCDERVSSTAAACVHCGNVLKEGRPGTIGYAVRVVYWVFVAIIVAAATISFGLAAESGGPAMVPLVLFVAFLVWFVVSISAAVLLYVTRAERLVDLPRATRPPEQIRPQKAARVSDWGGRLGDPL